MGPYRKEDLVKQPLLHALAVLLAVAPANAAYAQAAQADDLRCLLAMGAMQSNADQNLKSAGMMGSLYFLGKIAAAQPDIDLGGQLASEAAKLKGQPAQPLFQRCLQEFNTWSQQLVALSARVSAALQ